MPTGSVARRDGLRRRDGGRELAHEAGTHVTAGGGQAGLVPCPVCICACWEQQEPSMLLSLLRPFREKP